MNGATEYTVFKVSPASKALPREDRTTVSHGASARADNARQERTAAR
ncbi:hypothetical protein [Halostagnicola kamekurae]|nr:hypothetical protein [Halostagnicola kamekurae]